MEAGRYPLTVRGMRALLSAYDAPEEEAEAAAALMTAAGAGHLHQVEPLRLGGVWTPALRAAARETVSLSTGPLQPHVTTAAALAPGRRISGRRATLLLHESALDRADCEQLAHLIHLVDTEGLTVHLVPAAVPAPPGRLWTEWTLAAWGWDGSAAQRDGRQLYVSHAPQQQPLIRNGAAGNADRQMIQAAARRALAATPSLRQLQQVVRAARRSAPLSARRGPAAPTSAGTVPGPPPVLGAYPARVHHALLGRSGHLVDHAVAQRLIRASAWWPHAVMAERLHGQPMVRHLAGREGHDQFLVLGGGPEALPVHRIASAFRPSRTVYVDQSPVAREAWRAPLPSGPPAQAAVVLGGNTAPDVLLDGATVRALDWTRRISVLVHDAAHFLDDETLTHLMSVLRERLPQGSVISLTHMTTASCSRSVHRVVPVYRQAGISLRPRHLVQITALRGSWPAHMLEPGEFPWCAVLMRTPGPSRSTVRPSGRQLPPGARSG
ncbi:S-adenosyl methyltransferase [Streptomyces sp. PsTaAH-130]|nr:S-adenosyl methyltransferase [Streptomyces sp. PsTaAH-130]